MKIEKLNDNQIRCILSPTELLKRHLTIKKLSWANADARQLFHEMLEQSHDELGFEPNEFPLVVEAQQLSEGNLALTLTKVHSLEELPSMSPQSAEFLKALQTIIQLSGGKEAQDDSRPQPEPLVVFSFDESRGVTLPPTVKADPKGVHSSLYYAPKQHLFYLTVSSAEKYASAFCSLCYLLSEYGRPVPSAPGLKEYCDEHYVTVFAKGALQKLAAGKPYLPASPESSRS